jgi:hypothetical protein
MKLFTQLSLLCLCSFGWNAHAFFGITQIEKCETAYTKVESDPTNQKFIGDCLTACQYSSYNPTVHRDYNRLKAGYDYCAKNPSAGGAATATGAAARCDAAAALLTSSAAQEPSVWDACVTDCDAAVAEATQDTLKQRYSGTAAGCLEKTSTTTPQDPITDDGGTVADDAGGSTTGDVADTGNPNTPALNNAISGMSANSSGLRPIDPGRGVNFRGSGNSPEGYGAVANGIGGGFGPQSGDVIPPQRFDDVVTAAGEAPQADAANFGGGGGAMGGGAGGMGAMGGMGGGVGGGGGRPGAGGGARPSAAGAQLAKQGNNQFWAGGSGGVPAGGKAAARTTATALKVPLVEKPKFGPEYLNKGTGNDGLLRLWGAGMNRLPVNRNSQSCRDQTIFCNLENFDFEFKP